MGKKIISYALFGFNTERNPNCFDFNSYLRDLMLNVRLRRLLFPEWKIRLHVDQSTYDGYRELFENLKSEIEISIEDSAPLTKAMLWRMKPLFDESVEYVLCRDLDSPLTYRDAQAVQDWVNSGKVAHAITDSISHTLPMLGGMVGFWRKYFKDYTGFQNWNDMVNVMGGYEIKGADQDFLNQFVYPKFAKPGSESIVQHYVKGMPNTFLNGYKDHIPNIDIGLNEDLKESNIICGHIGSAGHYSGAMFKFLRKHWHKFNDILEIEKQYDKIFYWVNEG